MKKPLIGVTALVDYGRESLWMLPGYFEGISEAGGVAVMLPVVSDMDEARRLMDTVDGLLIAGGQDVGPEMYGDTKLSVCGETSPERDVSDVMLLDEALRLNKPVLGICRGIQLINAHLGGTLYQDLPSQHPSDVCHRQAPPYDRPSHEVIIARGTPLWEIFRVESLPVNSCHHQAIRTLAPGLQAMGVSEDGLVEAVYLPERSFLFAVQWHPEFSHKADENSRKIFRAFVKSCI